MKPRRRAQPKSAPARNPVDPAYLRHGYKTVVLSEVKPWERNPRTHSAAQIKQLRASIREFGFTNPLLIDEKGRLIAGHGRRTAAMAEGMTKAPAIELRGLSTTQKRALVIADNQLALTASWDDDLLRLELEALGKDGFDLSLVGFSDTDVARLLGPTAGDTDPDEVPEVPVKPVSKLGDVWLLGTHRLVCGDCTKPETWARLEVPAGCVVFSSPPYNVGRASSLRDRYKPGTNSKRRMYQDYDDNLSETEYVALLTKSVACALERVDSVAFNVQLLAGSKRPLLHWLNDHASHLTDVITWSKQKGSPHIQPGILTAQFEWIVLLSKSKDASRVVPHSSWQGKVSNVYEAPAQSVNEFSKTHGATFPVHLPEWIMGTLMDKCVGVVDCFCGTGTTLIAAERLGRLGFGIEIAPAYVDVAIERWQKFTGKEATLEADGHRFSVVKQKRHGKARAA